LLSNDTQTATKAETPVDLSNAIVTVAQQNIPAVVHLNVTQGHDLPIIKLCPNRHIPLKFN